MRSICITTVLVAAACFAACGNADESTFTPPGTSGGPGSSGDPGGLGGAYGDAGPPAADVASLEFDPPSQTLTLDGVKPGTAQFRLKAKLKSGGTVDVAPESLQFDRPDIASAANGIPITLTAGGTFAGTGKVHGIYGKIEAIADLTVKVARREVGSGIPDAVITALDGANLGPDPSLNTLRYPYDKTVFPLGLTSPLLMWDAPVSNEVYKLHYEEDGYTYDRYLTAAKPAQLRIDQEMWDRVTASNKGDPLELTIARYSKANSKAFLSTSVTWTVAPVSLRGAIYYWTAKKLDNVEAGKIVRIRVGAGSKPETMSTGLSGQTCMGCHAVSADGSTLAASVQAAPTGDPSSYAYTNGWIPPNASVSGRAWASFDLPSGTVRKQTKMVGNNLALTPDGKYTVFGGRMQTHAQAQGAPEQWQAGSKYMTLADTKTGNIIVDSGLDDAQLTAGNYGLSMPAFSPDGRKLAAVEFAYATNAEIRDNVIPDSNAVLVFGFDPNTLKFNPTPTRLPLGTFTPYTNEGIGYPSFTPNGNYVAYHVGNHSTGCWSGSGCDDKVQHRGALYYQSTNGSGAPVRLAALNDPPASGDRELSVEPTFNPVERGGYTWVVFTSMRDWGNKLTGTANNGKRRLWVAAIDAKTGAADPSHPAFYLDGQEETPNMRGFWTLAQCIPTPPPGTSGGACTAGFECCSGFCDKGVCVDVSAVSCVGIGGLCASSGDCCNPSAVECVNKKCLPKEVK
jgi:hypothetical protein